MSNVELPDIQALVRHGYGYFKDAVYCLFHIEDKTGFGDWLEDLRKTWLDDAYVRKGELAPEEFSVAIAFTASGLRKLGLAEALNTFPSEFQEGMVVKHRSRLLGDEGDNCPSGWEWGATKRGEDLVTDERVHGVVIVFADKKRAYDYSLALEYQPGSPDFIHRIATELQVKQQKRTAGKQALVGKGEYDEDDEEVAVEPFGFADGISQPYIEGLTLKKPPPGIRTIKAGEFVLGYLNEAGNFPASPSVKNQGCLQRLEELSGRADLGCNGTFLVIRQLKQEVDRFKTVVNDDTLAAKLVGRWKTGEALVSYPDPRPKLTDDDALKSGHKPRKQTRRELVGQNGFGYHREDRYGFRCPIGAHIRRANPRDALADGLGIDRETAQGLVDQHRLLRRGRVYEKTDAQTQKVVETGLIFVCINANIERQFEFVQSSWLLNKEFGGLHGETDPIVGPGGSITLQNPVLGKCVAGLKQFVTVKGGGYFFLPGMNAIAYLARVANQSLPPP